MNHDCEAKEAIVSFGLVFESADWQSLEIAVRLVPELAIVAYILKRIHLKEIKFPLEKRGSLVALMPAESIEIAGYSICITDIETFIAEEVFPIQSVNELAQVLYIAFNRCKESAYWATQAPPNAEAALRRYRCNQKRLNTAMAFKMESSTTNQQEVE